jgi:prepilin-type N-terminal cleavage/methylation domain-containing protein
VRRGARGFTLVEVLVALMIVAIGLSALMVAVSGAARTSGYLRDKTLAQWIALNRLSEVRLNTNKFGQLALRHPLLRHQRIDDEAGGRTGVCGRRENQG